MSVASWYGHNDKPCGKDAGETGREVTEPNTARVSNMAEAYIYSRHWKDSSRVGDV